MLRPGMNVAAMSKKLFHYTQVVSAVKILRDGVIRCSTVPPPPAVWLSSNPTNEPTARCLRLPLEQFRKCDAHAAILFRWARFVFHECTAIPWADLQLPSATRRNLKQEARDKGGRPQDWFALPNDVPCRDLPLEIETIEGRWQETGQDDLARNYVDLEVALDENGQPIPPFKTRRRA